MAPELPAPLTLNAELDRVTDVLSLAVGHTTHVVSGAVASQTLQHQRHVAHDDAVSSVLLKDLALE